MRRPLATGLAIGAGLGLLVPRAWERRARSGAMRALGLNLSGGVANVGVALTQPPQARGGRRSGRLHGRLRHRTDVSGLSHARWVTQIALVAARRRVWIANAYFVPPPEVLGALGLLPVHGVDVRLLLPGPWQDHPTVTFLQRRLYRRLERAGVGVWEYQPSMMHAKTMLVDDRLVVVGSINLDWLSLEWLEEGCLVVDDRPFAAELERRWRLDLSRSRQATLTAASLDGPWCDRSRRPKADSKVGLGIDEP